ncbi:MAG: ABC transporter substrate-binding protein [Rhodospirillales bacterium]|nr:ABC transporter substrate-binding protein [Rhodospirillales bacterium]
MKKLLAITAAIVMLLGVDSAMAAKVKVGFIAPFSGGFAIWGKQFRDSVEAFQKLNGTSVNGNEIEIIYRDVGGPNPAKAKQLAEELILRDRVKIITGLVFSNNTMALAPVINEAQVPTVIMNAATSKITRMSDMFVRVSMTLPQQSRPVALWAAKNGVKTVYTIVSDYAPGHDAERQFIKDYTSHGGKIVKSVRIPLRTTDYAPFLENVLQAKPDALYIFMPAGPPSIATVNAWAKRGLKKAGIQLLATGEMQQIFLPATGDAAIGVVSALHYTETNTLPANLAMRKALTDLHGKGKDYIPDIASVGAWDGMRLIYDAVGKLGPDFTGKQLIDFSRGREFDSPRGPLKIDPVERDAIQNMYIRRVVKRNGVLVNEDFDVMPMMKDPGKE